MPDWSHPNPIFCDFETQSACDIKASGGRAYVEHASTRILILAMCVDDVFHVWIPDYIRVNTDSWTGASLWPYQIKPAKEVKLYRGDTCSIRVPLDRPLVAHNAYGFDRGIWNRFLPPTDNWLDTLLLAKQSGRSGKLDSLGKSLLGIGKDHAKKLLPKLTTATRNPHGDGWAYPVINSGDLQAFTRYAVGDVEILRRLWPEFDSVKVEADVIECHDAINQRGICADAELLECIERVSEYSVTQALNEIKVLTRGRLHEDNIRSGMQVADWLGKYGVKIVDDKGKPCLRKEIVQKFIDSPYVIEDNLTAAVEIPPICIDVMRLRMKGLRITDAKVKKARNRIGPDGRIKDLFAYHNSHTGRWSSFGVNIHNLPRPKEDISAQVEHLLAEETVVPFVPRIDTSERDVKRVYDLIKANIPAGTSTVDDVCSMLIRPCFRAAPRHTFTICDYAQVEARGVAWMAGETKMLAAFREGRDLYREFAAKVFHVDLADVTKTMRQIAKSAVLGCIAEGETVYTDSGPKAIEQVTLTDLVWDGLEYVSHSGVIHKGERKCLRHQSLPMLTADHLVLSTRGWVEAGDVITESISLRSGCRSVDGRLLLNASTSMETTNQGTFDSLPEVSSVAIPVEVKRTYDILNCGPRNRYQVGNIIAHNCGYGLGADKFRVYAANNGCDLSAANITAEEVIDAYRDEYTKIAGWKPKATANFRVGGLWKDMGEGCKNTVESGVPHDVGPCRFLLEANTLKLVLPSERELYYPNARIEDVIPPYCYTMGLALIPKATVVYESDRGTKSLYGGLLVENCIQALCRDIMATHMIELTSIGLNVVAHVHDEIVCEVPVEHSRESLERVVSVMSRTPAWGRGFPLSCEGYVCPRFAKSPFTGAFHFDTKRLKS